MKHVLVGICPTLIAGFEQIIWQITAIHSTKLYMPGMSRASYCKLSVIVYQQNVHYCEE